MSNESNALRTVFIRDLTIETVIGIHPQEKHTPQRIIVNVWLDVPDIPVRDSDDYSKVVCYETVAAKVRALAAKGHVNLVETMAERIAAACLEDERISRARIRIEKPDIFPDCAGVGIEIERRRAQK